MGTSDKWVLRAFVGLVAFNVLQIFFYGRLWSWTAPIDGRHPLSLPTKREESLALEKIGPSFAVDVIEPAKFLLKPWPAVPSLTDWSPDPNLKPFSCEAYFGNGFTQERRILGSFSKEKLRSRSSNATLRARRTDPSGAFRCFYSETLKTSVCEGRKLVMNLDRISLGRGGEDLDEVIGREEDEEVPEFAKGAFQIRILPRTGGQDKDRRLDPGTPLFEEASVDQIMPAGQIGSHTMRSLLLNLEPVDSRSVNCSQRVRQPTLIVTRFEYANLFHTSTDWFSAYISSRVAGLDVRPRLVFLDGHCKSPMDDGWEAMFSSVTYAKHFIGPVCFEHAIFAPLGYDVPLFKHISHTLGCQGVSVEELAASNEHEKALHTARLREFGEVFTASFESNNAVEKVSDSSVELRRRSQDVNVLFVRREDYLAHPRHTGRPESRLSNEEEVWDALMQWAVEKSTNRLNVTVINGLLAHMPLADQIRAVKKADVLVGAHGAGLTHLIFAKPTTIVLELSSPYYRRPHFATMSYWMGMDYRVIEMDNSFVRTSEVIKKMNEILEDVEALKKMI